MITPLQVCAYFDLMYELTRCNLPSDVPLLPSGPVRPVPRYSVATIVRVPLGSRELPIIDTRYLNDRWWYAVDIHPGCRKWYAEQVLCPVVLEVLERAA